MTVEPAPVAPARKPFWRRPLGCVALLVGLCIVFAILSTLLSGGSDSNTASTLSDEVTESPTGVAVQTEPTEASEDEAPAEEASEAEPTEVPTAEEPATEEATEAPAEQPTEVPVEQPTEAPATSEPVGIGERASAAGLGLIVLGTSTTNQINEFLTPQTEGNTFLVLDVVVENLDIAEGAPYNPLYFSIKDAESFEYQPSLIAPAPTLSSGEGAQLLPGERVRGNVAFEVPPTATGFVVS